MGTQEVTTRAYDQKINTQLQQAKAQLGELESRAKGKMAQTEMNTINQLKIKHQDIDKKRQDLKTTAGPKVEQVKAEIDADMAKLKTSLSDLGTKLKVEPRTKAS